VARGHDLPDRVLAGFVEFPARYSADVARRRRWIRGDWQLVGWLRRHVKGPDGASERNPLSLLSQWKLLDNLNRPGIFGDSIS
jgi:hypothetical protein